MILFFILEIMKYLINYLSIVLSIYYNLNNDGSWQTTKKMIFIQNKAKYNYNN